MSPLKQKALKMLENTHRTPEMYTPERGMFLTRMFDIIELVDLGEDFDHHKFRKELFPYKGNGPTLEWLHEAIETEWARKKIEDVAFLIRLRGK